MLLEIHTKERFNFICNKTLHLFAQSRIYPHPEAIIHDQIGIAQIATNYAPRIPCRH